MKPLIAGLMQVGGCADQILLRSSLANLRNLSDRLIVLEDNSLVLEKLLCDEVLHMSNVEPWSDYGNRLTLLSRGAAHGCLWSVLLDDDETFEPSFTKPKLIEVIREATERGCELIEFKLCEMWNETQYRCDGIWNEKRRVRVQKNPLLSECVHWRVGHFAEHHTTPLQIADVFQTDIRILHFGMSSPERRAERVTKWEKLDPQHLWQPRGYSYMLDETGLELKDV